MVVVVIDTQVYYYIEMGKNNSLGHKMEIIVLSAALISLIILNKL